MARSTVPEPKQVACEDCGTVGSKEKAEDVEDGGMYWILCPNCAEQWVEEGAEYV